MEAESADVGFGSSNLMFEEAALIASSIYLNVSLIEEKALNMGPS